MNLEHIDSLSFPEWALCAIHYGDFSGLTAEEIEQVESFALDYPAARFVFHFEDSRHFSSRPAFGLPCDCIDLLIYEIKQTENA